MIPQITLLPKKDEALKRFHPWVFSGAIKAKDPVNEGDLVRVCSNKGDFLGLGFYNEGSIAIKIISFEDQDIDQNFWNAKIEKAWNLRLSLGLLTNSNNIFRLAHGEGDHLPGLILDFYAGVVVFQAHSFGMWQVKDQITTALKTVLGKNLLAVYDKSKETLPKKYEINNGYLLGAVAVPHLGLENNHKFQINWETGQKTGFFIDQRENRKLLATYAKGKKVLNTFCYSGGFSVFAASNGAEKVTSVDVSKTACELVKANFNENFGADFAHEVFAEDVMSYLKKSTGEYDLIVLDPPAYAKNLASKKNAIQGYRRLNAEGIKHAAKGGVIFTFSCSQIIGRSLFQDIVVSAALDVGRSVQILGFLSQGPDHPINLFHPEGSYLKGLILKVD